MNLLGHWKPFRAIDKREEPEESRVPREDLSYWSPFSFSGRNAMAMDMHETNRDYVITTALPGVKPEDIQIKVEGDVLTIRGETHESSDNEQMRRQFYREYERSIRLPQPIDSDKAVAEYHNGELRLTLPKNEMVQGKAITVKTKDRSVPVKTKR